MSSMKIARIFFLLFCACFFALALSQFSVIFSFGQGNFYLFDLLIAGFDFFGLIYLLKLREVKLPTTFLLLLAFVALGTISLIFTPLNLESTEFFTALAYPVRFLCYVVFANIVWNFVQLKMFSRNQLLLTIIFSGIFLFFAGLIQLILLPDLETLDSKLGWDPHKNRMVSTFFDPNFLGMYFVICLSAVFSYFKSLTNRALANTHRIFAYSAIVVFIFGIFLTFSRSAWLALAVFIFFVGLKNKLLLASSTALMLLAVFAIPRAQTRISGITDPQDSAGFRLISWQNAWEITKDNWVFGVGYNAFRYAQRDYGFLDDANLASHSGAGSDSSLLLVWSTSGIFGLIFLMSTLLVWLYTTLKNRDLISLGTVVSLLINSVFINSFFYPQIIVGVLLTINNSSPKLWWPLKDSNL